jgi:hypothetical protein
MAKGRGSPEVKRRAVSAIGFRRRLGPLLNNSVWKATEFRLCSALISKGTLLQPPMSI